MDSKLLLNADTLRGLRRSQGLSQEGLAYACEKRQLRVSIATIKRAEAGKQVSFRTANELSKFFDIEIDNLLAQNTTSVTPENKLLKSDSESNSSFWTILWLRLEDMDAVPDVMEILQRRGSIWQEQLGSAVLATFGNYCVAGKGHIHAQQVMLDLKKMLLERAKPPKRFYAALQFGTVFQRFGQSELAPQTLQWFAKNSADIPVNGIVVSKDIYCVSNVNFSYIPHNLDDFSSWLLQGEVCLEQVIPLVGRSSELLHVNALLDSVGEREVPAIVHVTGPAGIGKSRFLSAIHEQARLREIVVTDVDVEVSLDDPVGILTKGLCARFLQHARSRWSNSQLINLLFDADCQDEQQFLIADLLSLEHPDHAKFDNWKKSYVPDVGDRVNAMATLFSCLLGKHGYSLLISIDNIHLGGEEGYKLLGELLSNCRHIPLTCVVTSRSEVCSNQDIQEIAGKVAQLSTLILGTLSHKDSQVLSREFDSHNDDYKQHCIRLAEGVPLYLIQLLTNKSNSIDELPSSLNLLVEQKLLHLSVQERHVVELLSVCNAPLPVSSISEIAAIEKFSPEKLVMAQLVKVDEDLGVKLCHQLVRKIVYNNIPENVRQRYHAILACYGENNPDFLNGLSMLSVARHYELSGQRVKAAEFINKGSKKLLQEGEYDKALELLHHAVELLGGCETKECLNIEIDIELALSGIYKIKYGWVSPLLKRSYQRIESLCERMGRDKRLVMALFGLWTIELATLNLHSAEELANRCLSTAKLLHDEQGCMCAYIAIANTLFWNGKHQQAELAARESLSHFHQDYTETSIQLIGLDPRALAGCFGAWSSALLGNLDAAEQYRKNVLDEPRMLQHEFSHAIALQGRVLLDYHNENPVGVLRDAEKLEALSKAKGFPFYQGIAALFVGWARHKLFHDPVAVDYVCQGYHKWLSNAGDKIAYSLYCVVLGDVYVGQNRFEKAREVLEQGISFAIKNSHYCYVPEMFRFLSFCLAGSERVSCLLKGLRYAADSPLFAKRINDILCNN